MRIKFRSRGTAVILNTDHITSLVFGEKNVFINTGTDHQYLVDAPGREIVWAWYSQSTLVPDPFKTGDYISVGDYADLTGD